VLGLPTAGRTGDAIGLRDGAWWAFGAAVRCISDLADFLVAGAKSTFPPA
jgi:hypothetical protein